MEKDTLVLPSLSPVGDKPISVMIDARCTSADGGVLLFQDVERRLNLANRLAACLHDPRQPGKITHPLDEILRFRMLAIVAGYPDGNDCDVLRDDPAFKMALDRPPVSGPALCSQPTVSRVENLAQRTELYRMGEAMLELYCDSFPVVPHHLTLDLDESFDRVHGEQELRKFNAYYDDWGFLPIHIFDTSGRLVLSVLREAATPSGREILDSGQAGGRSYPRALSPGPDPPAGRQPLCLSGSDELVRGQRPGVHLRPVRKLHPGGPGPGARSAHGGAVCRAPCDRAGRVQAAPSVLHGWDTCRKGASLFFDAPDLAFMPHESNADRRHHISRPKRRVTNGWIIMRRCGSGAV